MSTRDEYRRKLNDLNRKQIIPGSYLDWDVFDEIERNTPVLNEISSYLDHNITLSDNFQIQISPWRQLFAIKGSQYRDLILEFHATYSFDSKVKSANQQGALQFRLGGEFHQLTLTNLAEILNLYPLPLLRHPEFTTFLDATTKDVKESNTYAFWSQITNQDYEPGVSKAIEIQDPLLRIFHRLFTKTITARNDGDEKVNLKDLSLLYCLVNRMQVNIPFWVGRFLQGAKGRTISSPIMGGQFITIIAQRLNVFNRVNLRSFVKYDMKELGREYLTNIGACTSNNLPNDLRLAPRNANEEQEARERGNQNPNPTMMQRLTNIETTVQELRMQNEWMHRGLSQLFLQNNIDPGPWPQQPPQ